ncbi:cytochrome P450 2B4-like [Saccostrea echinata]|uniref:cytochrome P450 2B4-like n=1 Tax=Saccostrea echinata TaxID=191078 RepID=UPI002A7FD8DE|nr:cytochrome P450 2B4-like [Saccostrea echinata]
MLDLIESVEVSIGLIIAIILLLFYLTRTSKNLPPGPPTWPIIGSAINFQKIPNMRDAVREMRAKYGDVFRITRFGRHVIYINGLENLREIFIKKADAFSDRPSNYHTRYILKGHGVLASSGENWKEHRTFALTTLRSFGFGKRSLETQIMEEATCFTDQIAALKGGHFDPNEYIHVSISNIMCSIAFGKRYEHSDTNFQHLLTLVTQLAAEPRNPLLDMFPILGLLPGDVFGARKLERLENSIQNFAKGILKEHQETFDGINIRDYIDAYLLEQAKQQQNEETTFTEEQLICTLRDFFIAGSETTTTTLKWAMTFLVNFPEVQTKMRTEIDDVIGSRPVSLTDRDNLPYCDAVITETLRLGDIVPMSLPHTTSYDVTWNGFTIPKGATVWPCLDSVLNDDDLFPDPEHFKPERFLNSEGKRQGHDKAVIPFSLGRRVCLGESLARMELFLFLVTIVQRFELKASPNHRIPSLNGFFGTVHGPHPYNICAIERT